MNYDDLVAFMRSEGASAYQDCTRDNNVTPGMRYYRVKDGRVETCRWKLTGNVYIPHSTWDRAVAGMTIEELQDDIRCGFCTAMLPELNNAQAQDDDLADYAELQIAELRKLNHDLAVLLGRVSYFLEFMQNMHAADRKQKAKQLLEEINKATGATK